MTARAMCSDRRVNKNKNKNLPSDEEMIEDSDNVFGVQCFPKRKGR